MTPPKTRHHQILPNQEAVAVEGHKEVATLEGKQQDRPPLVPLNWEGRRRYSRSRKIPPAASRGSKSCREPVLSLPSGYPQSTIFRLAQENRISNMPRVDDHSDLETPIFNPQRNAAQDATYVATSHQHPHTRDVQQLRASRVDLP